VPLLIVAELGRDWGWTSPLTLGLLALGIAGVIAFILVERAAGESALIPLSLFKNVPFARTQVLGFIVGIAMFGGMVTLPLILQVAYGATPTMAGFLMLPMVAGMMTASIASGQITGATGKYRIFLNTGSGLLALAFVYMVFFLDAETPLWVMSIGMVFIGLGLGQLMQTLMIASQNAVEAKNIGVATSSATFFRQIGGTLGVAVFMTVLFSRVQDQIDLAFARPSVVAGLESALADPAVLANPANKVLLDSLQGQGEGLSITADSSFLIGADDRLTAAFRIGFVESALSIFVIAAILMTLGFVMSWFIRGLPLRTKSAAQENAESERENSLS